MIRTGAKPYCSVQMLSPTQLNSSLQAERWSDRVVVAAALLGRMGPGPNAVVAVDSLKPSPVKIFADMCLIRDDSAIPDSSALASRKHIVEMIDRGEPPEPVPLVCLAAAVCLAAVLGCGPLPRVDTLFARSPLAPVWPGVDIAAPPGFGIFGQFGPIAVATGNDHLETSPLERAAGRITTGKYAADMPRACPRHTRRWSSPPVLFPLSLIHISEP